MGEERVGVESGEGGSGERGSGEGGNGEDTCVMCMWKTLLDSFFPSLFTCFLVVLWLSSTCATFLSESQQ